MFKNTGLKDIFSKASLFNLLWFYCIWFSAVAGQSSLILLTLFLLGVHFYLHRKDRQEFLLTGIVAVIGIMTDSVFQLTGVFIFSGHAWLPLWLVLLWPGFAATLRHSLRFLSKSRALCSVFGAVGGPLSYCAGARLGAVDFGYSLAVTITVLALVWALLLPVFFWIDKQISGSDQ